MAYVAISHGLKSDIRSKINKLREGEVNTLKVPENSTIKMQHDEPAVLALIWGEHLHLRTQIPEAWTQDTHRITLSYRCKGEHDSVSVHLNIEPQDGRFRVPRTNNVAYYGMDINYDDETSPPPEIMASQIAYGHELAVINSRWAKVQTDVSSFLDNCKSLNEALKLWPDLKIYVPDRYIEKVNESVQRVKKAQEENAALKALQSIDTDFAVAAAVGARMAQAAAGQTPT